MKHLIILGDGMADEPIPELNGRTPLQQANTAAMDQLAREGATGLLQTVQHGYHPGSEVANMAVLGYDMDEVYEGRGVLEAASIGVQLEPGEMAMRCNLVSIEKDLLINHSADHITTEEAHVLINYLNEHLGSDRVAFYPGVSYRHLLVIKGGNKHLDCTPPHDIPLMPFEPALIKPQTAEAQETAELLNELIFQSQKLLSMHPVNLKRIASGKSPANSIWPWSPGYRPAMQTMKEQYGVNSGAVISAVDLIKGIGRYAGLDIIEVEGATGLYDTNYEGKVKAALQCLQTKDFVYLHVEASDEAGHEGDVALKVRTIEDLDKRVVAPIMKAVRQMNEPIAIAVLPDHPTPCAIRTHTAEPVPFIIYKPGMEPDATQQYDEFSVKENGRYGLLKGDEFIRAFLDPNK